MMRSAQPTIWHNGYEPSRHLVSATDDTRTLCGKRISDAWGRSEIATVNADVITCRLCRSKHDAAERSAREHGEYRPARVDAEGIPERWWGAKIEYRLGVENGLNGLTPRQTGKTIVGTVLIAYRRAAYNAGYEEGRRRRAHGKSQPTVEL